jgi:WD40 repeat protein
MPSTVRARVRHEDEVWAIQYSHNGIYLASASKDKRAIIWDLSGVVGVISFLTLFLSFSLKLILTFYLLI